MEVPCHVVNSSFKEFIRDLKEFKRILRNLKEFKVI